MGLGRTWDISCCWRDSRPKAMGLESLFFEVYQSLNLSMLFKIPLVRRFAYSMS